VSDDAVQEAVYDVFADSTDAIFRRVAALDREFHEHGSDCEMRCPRERLRVALLDCLDDIGRASERHFMPVVQK